MDLNPALVSLARTRRRARASRARASTWSWWPGPTARAPLRGSSGRGSARSARRADRRDAARSASGRGSPRPSPGRTDAGLTPAAGCPGEINPPTGAKSPLHHPGRRPGWLLDRKVGGPVLDPRRHRREGDPSRRRVPRLPRLPRVGSRRARGRRPGVQTRQGPVRQRSVRRGPRPALDAARPGDAHVRRLVERHGPLPPDEPRARRAGPRARRRLAARAQTRRRGRHAHRRHPAAEPGLPAEPGHVPAGGDRALQHGAHLDGAGAAGHHGPARPRRGGEAPAGAGGPRRGREVGSPRSSGSPPARSGWSRTRAGSR